MSDVTTIVVGDPPLVELADRTAELLRIADAAALRGAAGRARHELLWVLDARARPAAGALAPLLDHADAPAVSLAVRPDGTPDTERLGRFTEDDVPGVLAASARRRLPLRHTSLVSMLVARDLVRSMPSPDPARFGPHADAVWTARLFARQRGMLVPASTVIAPDRPAASVAQTVRAVRTGVWGRGETVRELGRGLGVVSERRA